MEMAKKSNSRSNGQTDCAGLQATRRIRRVHAALFGIPCALVAEEASVSTRLRLQMVFLLVFCLPGVAILGYSMNLAASTMELTRSGLVGTGIVVRYERPRYQGRKVRLGSSLCPVVEFRYHDKSHAFADDWCSKSPGEHPPGSSLSVVFDPGFPEVARINQFWELHGASLVSAAIGAPWLLIGIALVIRVR